MTDLTASAPLSAESQKHRSFLFVACFVALVATAFAFAIRSFIIGDLQEQFHLTETQKGEILGAGFWPFGISIVLFSLIIDRIGYGKSMIFAFGCHVASVFVTVFATGYWSLWSGSVLAGLAAGTVEAVVNPVVASMYAKHKTKMLTMLHGGWAGGVALGGALTLTIGGAPWATKVYLLLIPTGLYGLMMLRCRFPINERVAAGVPYKDMLKECGMIGALIVAFMIIWRVGTLLGWEPWLRVDVLLFAVMCVGIYTQSFGRGMYSFLLLIMILLAITELGTDGWMKELRDPGMAKLGIDGGWILVYTASIMLVLRFCIGPIVKVLKPLGVLLGGALFAAAGLFLLSGAELPIVILLTATIYGIGQAFFWPVTLGIVAERFPKGGALTLNAIAGVGMLGVGIIGGPLMGYMQDTNAVSTLEKNSPALVETYVDEDEKDSVFGSYRALNVAEVNRLNGSFDLYGLREKIRATLDDQAQPDALESALANNKDYASKVRWAYDVTLRPAGDTSPMDYDQMFAALDEQGLIVDQAAFDETVKPKHDAIAKVHKKSTQYAMRMIAILPLIMAGCYLGLILYFRAKGGYKVIELTAQGQASEHAATPTEAVTDAEETPSE